MSKKSKTKNILALILVMMVMMAVGYIYGFYRGPVRGQDNENEGTDISKLALAENKSAEMENGTKKTTTVISPGTEIVFNSDYLRCRDVTVERRKAYREEIGLKQEDIQELFPEWTIGEFTDKRVVFERKIDNYCPDHYILKEQGGLVNIYVPLKGEEGLELIDQTSVKVQSLPLDIQQEINNGIAVESLEQVEYMIESWQS